MYELMDLRICDDGLPIDVIHKIALNSKRIKDIKSNYYVKDGYDKYSYSPHKTDEVEFSCINRLSYKNIYPRELIIYFHEGYIDYNKFFIDISYNPNSPESILFRTRCKLIITSTLNTKNSLMALTGITTYNIDELDNIINFIDGFSFN